VGGGSTSVRQISEAADASTAIACPLTPRGESSAIPARRCRALMCGIYGVVAGPDADPTRRIVDRMAASLFHRGPDGDGIMRHGRAVLGCRRLAIVDVAGGAQPITDETGDVVAVCNGEIYNAPDLRRWLEGRGHRFRTRSDAEVIPHLYEERGTDFVEALDGMFGLAVWDGRAERLVLARDRMGEKPLYYAHTAHGFLFASEPKAIIATGLVAPAADGAGLAGYLRTGYVAGARSAFAGVSRLVPGTRLVIERDESVSDTFWELGPLLAEPPLDVDLATAAGLVRAELERAVAAALMSDVPVGVFLSGGLDSSCVAGIARRILGPDLDTFTIAFDVPGFDERRYATLVARELGTRHHVLTVTPELFLAGLRELAPLLDEPIADQSLVPTFLLARHARTRVKVVLVGEGSDELFAGYPTYVGGLLAERYGRLPAGVRRALRRWAPRMGASPGNITLSYMVRRFLEMAEAPAVVRHRAWTGCMSGADVEALSVPGGPLVMDDPPEGFEARSELDRLLGLDLTGYLRDELLTNLDRATMAASLEGRAPFMNHHLVELACRLPAELKLRRLVGKRVLRRAVADLVPAATVRRVKRGLSVPLAAWLAGPLLPFARETLARLDPNVIRPAVVRELLQGHVERRRDNRRELWALIMLQLWADACGVVWSDADPEEAERTILASARG
jgi:asparagine synthase (glutamine-hydrolysing)